MKAFLTAAVLLPVGSGYLRTSWEDLQTNQAYSFADYVAEYGKQYGGAEYAARQIVFSRQVKKIREHNAGASSWKMGLNQFSDWEEKEVKQKMTGLSGTQPVSVDVHQLPEGFRQQDLPDSIDWRTTSPSVVTAIKEQGLCGSCWAFAATESIESAAAIATGKLQVLSPQQLVSCAPNPDECGGKGGCDGSTPSLAFNYTMGVGLSLESSYPYKHTNAPCDDSQIQPVVSIKGFVDVPNNNATLLMNALTIGPVTISAAANWAAYERGVFDGPHGQPCGYDVNHAIVMMGYGYDADEKLNYWIIRNSWTPQWGEKGYMRILRAADGVEEPCGIDTTPQSGVVCKNDTTPKEYCGTCGLLSSSSYATGAFNI